MPPGWPVAVVRYPGVDGLRARFPLTQEDALELMALPKRDRDREFARERQRRDEVAEMMRDLPALSHD